MKNLLSFLVISLIIVSCSKESDKSIPAYSFDAFNVDFMNYYFLYGVMGDTNRVLLEYYPDGKLKRRIGDMVSVPVPPYPYPFAFSPYIVDSFSYVQNQVQVNRRMEYDGVITPIFVKTYQLENEKIIKITTEPLTEYSNIDTTVFIYNTEGVLDSSITHGYRSNHFILILTKKYAFDSIGNLIKVEGLSQANYVTEENFSGYDQAENPLINLTGLEDVFYRSLSRNNFADYSFKRTYFGSPHTWAERHWDFEYDGNNLPLFIRN
jgi:hypothetical protein